MNKEQITQWLDPNDKINTEYGFITQREWLHLETKRCGSKFFVGKSKKTGLLALFRKMERLNNEKRVKE